MAWGIGKNDAVFVPDFTYVASAEAPAQLGAVPFLLMLTRILLILIQIALSRLLLMQKNRV